MQKISFLGKKNVVVNPTTKLVITTFPFELNYKCSYVLLALLPDFDHLLSTDLLGLGMAVILIWRSSRTSSRIPLKSR